MAKRPPRDDSGFPGGSRRTQWIGSRRFRPLADKGSRTSDSHHAWGSRGRFSTRLEIHWTTTGGKILFGGTDKTAIAGICQSAGFHCLDAAVEACDLIAIKERSHAIRRVCVQLAGIQGGCPLAVPDREIRPRTALIAILSLAACAFLWGALITFSPGDWPSPHQFPHNDPPLNACGTLGAVLAFYFFHLLGDGAYPLILFATLAAILQIARGRVGNLFERAFGLALVIACTSASAHLVGDPRGAPLPQGHGGIVGFALGRLLTLHLSSLGTIIILVSCWSVGLVFATQGWVLQLPTLFRRAAGTAGDMAEAARNFLGSIPFPRAAALPNQVKPQRTSAPRREVLDEDDSADREAPSPKRRPPESAVAPNLADSEAERETEAEDKEGAPVAAPLPKQVNDSASEPVAEPLKTPATPAKAVPRVPIVNFLTPERAAAAEPYPRQIENWRLPDINLLREPTYNFNAQQEQRVRQQAKTLEQALEEFRVDARVVEIDTGPVITMFELKLGAGVKVSQIASLCNDMARALKAHAIRVVAPISGKNTVGIEVPNTEKERVRLRELMTLSGKKAAAMNLPLFLGKDAGGAALVTDLTAMPHLLIAGTTGSGKSVCLNAVILSLLMTKRPDHVKMILIDPKMVEMSQFKDVPHLMCPIVTEMPRAEKILEWAVTKMEERYELLAEARVKNIDGYNELSADELYARFAPENEQEKARISTHLPYIVIVIDELADLMMTAAKEVEHHLARLAQKSRAVGIHIIVATQRPEVKVVTGLIKSNLPARICFRVASRMDSRIVLDQNGGEVLMGQGDMLFLPPGSHKLLRAQGTYLEDCEVQAVLDDLAERAKPEFHPELIRLRATDAEAGAEFRDPLFDDAVRIILESKRGSVSLLQRRLTIGYSRASRLIDQMAEAGIVGDYKGSQAREVLMSLDEWDRLREQMQKELQDDYEADQEPESEPQDEPF